MLSRKRLLFEIQLLPGDGHRPFALFGVTNVDGTIPEVFDEQAQLFDRFVVGPFALFFGCDFRIAEDTGLRIAAGPGRERCRTMSEQVHITEGAVVFVDFNHAAFDFVFADSFFVEIQIQRRFQFTGM